MRTIRILHSADIHLDAPFRFLGQHGEAHRVQVRKTFDRICAAAVEGKYDLLLIAGDLFDSNSVSDSTVNWLISRLKDIAIPVCVCPGTHDCLDHASVYRRTTTAWPGNVFVFTDAGSHSIPALDLVVHARPNHSGRSAESPLDGIRRLGDARWEIGMAHGSIVIPGKVEGIDTPIRQEEIASSGLDYLALGHWHSWGDYSTEKVKAFYSGSPERLDFPGGPGTVASVTLSDGGVTVEKMEVGLRTMSEARITVTGMSSPDEAKREIVALADPNVALRVALEGLCDLGLLLNAPALESELAEKFFFLRVEDRSHPSINSSSASDFPEGFVIGNYVKLMSERIEAAHGDDELVRTLEDALSIGIAVLQGKQDL